MRRVGSARTETPGARTLITLDIGELAIPALLEGLNCSRIWLSENEDATYGLHADGVRLGDERDRGITPAVDILVDVIDGWADEYLDRDDVPQAVRDAWDEAIERFEGRRKGGEPR